MPLTIKGFPDILAISANCSVLFAPAGGVTLQKRKTGRINLHGHSKGTGSFDGAHLGFDGFQIPGFYCGNTFSVGGGNCFAGHVHNGAVKTIAGKSCDTGFGTGFYQNVVVAFVVVLIAVMGNHCTDRTGKERKAELLPENFKRSIRCGDVADGVQIDPDIQPFCIVAHGSIADTLGAGAGDAVAAGLAVADGAGFAFGHSVPGVGENFLISHCGFLLTVFLSVYHEKNEMSSEKIPGDGMHLRGSGAYSSSSGGR